MRIRLTILAITMVMLSSTLSKATTGTVADLPPELREALVRDAACGSTPEAASGGEADRARLLESAVMTRDISGAAGAPLGVIVSFSDACHCRQSNCRTYVYLKAGPQYTLAFSGVFTSLHPMRVYKRGHPSLSGKLAVSASQEESTIYDWNGKAYVPVLCATLTQAAGRKSPGIVHHECAKAQ
jgi:hypothetical protein